MVTFNFFIADGKLCKTGESNDSSDKIIAVLLFSKSELSYPFTISEATCA